MLQIVLSLLQLYSNSYHGSQEASKQHIMALNAKVVDLILDKQSQSFL